MECFCNCEPVLLHRDAQFFNDGLYQINTYKDDERNRWIVEYARMKYNYKTILKYYSYDFRDDAIRQHKYLRKHHFG